MNNQKGQLILTLILVMTMALAIGLSIVQKSLVDVSTATKVEQSSRAFSAAEAGIEKALQGDIGITSPIELGNQSKIEQVVKNSIPAQNQALEYPPLGKEDIAHVWLADPDSLKNYYTQTSLDLYWGTTASSGREQPALEVSVVYQDALGYKAQKFFIDPVEGVGGRGDNGFKAPADYGGGCTNYQITTSFSAGTNDRPFKCKITLSSLPNSASGLPKLILVRTRFLYNSSAQPLAVSPVGSCNPGCSLPPQARIFTSTGVSGEVQRKVQIFELKKVVPLYFDYAIFSAGEISK